MEFTKDKRWKINWLEFIARLKTLGWKNSIFGMVAHLCINHLIHLMQYFPSNRE